MSSDDAYVSFLEKANQDPSAGTTTTAPSAIKLKMVDADVPTTLQKIDQYYYTSEADEPFEPVSLKWEGKEMPSASEFASLIGHQAAVSTLEPKEFDPSGQYANVLGAVERAGGEETRVYRVATGRTRAEYYIVGFDHKAEKLVGLRAKAVES